MPRRVVVTGMGVLCALGKDTATVWQGLAEGRCGIGTIETADTSQLRFHQGAEVPGYAAYDYLDPKEADMIDRFAQFALIAARQAVTESGIEWNDDLRSRTAVITGSSLGGQCSEDHEFWEIYHDGKTRVNPLTIPRTMANAGASRVSLDFGLTGPTFTVASACSSSNHAIGQAFWFVRNGVVDAALAGGSEATFSFGVLKAWEAMRVVSTDTCRPFSKDRKGLILGEGAGMLFLETLESAQARGARILGEIVGFGMSSDAHHITQPAEQGAARAMEGALRDGGLMPEQIGYINAHGTGTPANDPTECAAIRKVFGTHAEKLALSSTKSMHGHALGAAGAIESVATLLALQHDCLPPTANFTEPDPHCNLDVIPNVARSSQTEYALSNSFAFGGLNAVLAFRKWL